MWLTSPPDQSETLRQGDILEGLFLPKLAIPLQYVRGPDDAVDESQAILLKQYKVHDFLVVSQCCTIEQQGVVALAPIRSTQPLKPEEAASYMLAEPPKDESFDFPMNHHRIDPVRGKFEPVKGRIFIADLTLIQTYQGKISDLQKSRIASMTQAGRRLLRIRLGLFWARPEQEDRKWFEAQGLAAGLSI